MTKMRNEETERVLNAKVASLTQKAHEEKTDFEKRYQEEQKKSYELKVQLDQLTKTLHQVRQENESLKAINKANEETLLKAELLEKETQTRFK